MAHMLDFTKGFAAFTRRQASEPAWHELGGETPADAPLEIWLRNAGMEFEYRKAQVRYEPAGWNGIKFYKDRHVLYRSDSFAPMAVVSDRYSIVQPRDVLEFFRSLIETMGFTMETAGVLAEGRRIWALAKVGQSLRIKGTDVLNSYLLLVTSCDTQLATTAMFTSVRVVCNNTLEVAVNALGESYVRVPHSRQFDPDEVKGQLGLLGDAWAGFEKNANALAARPIDDKELVQFLVKLMGDSDKPLKEQPNQRGMSKIVSLFKGGALGSDLAAAGNSAWGLVNAVSEYVDYHAQARSTASRLNSAWLGNGAKLKRTAWTELLKLAA